MGLNSSSSSSMNRSDEEGSHYNGEGCDPTTYHVEGAESEPLDLQINGLIWIPPEPENKEDDREAVLFTESKDDDDATGEWIGEIGSNEEHQKVSETGEDTANQSYTLDVAPLHNNFLQEEQPSGREEFPPSPSDQQSLVSLSTRCVWKGTVCERAHLFRIEYNGNFDKPLGILLRDHLFDQNYQCHSCGMPSEAHIHCYTHGQGSLTVSVKKVWEFPLAGVSEDRIWMWHRCLKCPRADGFPVATRRVLMSDAAWGFSFSKFLELSFSNHAVASRVANCGHSLHRDCLRFYGFGKMVACFQYASIDVPATIQN